MRATGRTFGALALATLAGLATAAGAAEIGSRNRAELMCSLVPIPGTKEVGAPYFLGHATKDTVFAGAGDIEPATEAAGHYGAADDRRIFGQYVIVSQLGGSGSLQMDSSTDTVVVVPWDYDGMCRPLVWGRSAAWLPPDGQRFFFPALRDRKHWVNGHPTFDARFPGVDVYPTFHTELPPLWVGLRHLDSAGVVTPKALFDFYEFIPPLPPSDEVSGQMLTMLRSWASDHPDLASAPPISTVLQHLVWESAVTRARHTHAPMLGTYRVELSLPGAAPRTVFIRTADRTDQNSFYFLVKAGDAEVDRERDPMEDPSVGFHVPFWLAETEEGLPEHPDWKLEASWGWHIAWPDSVRDGGIWPAEIDPNEFLFNLSDPDSILDRFYDAYSEWWKPVWEADALPAFGGSFSVSDDFEYFQEVPSTAGAMLIRASRISRDVVVADSTPPP